MLMKKFCRLVFINMIVTRFIFCVLSICYKTEKLANKSVKMIKKYSTFIELLMISIGCFKDYKSIQ